MSIDMDVQTENQASRNVLAASKIESYRKRLLDLSRRNTLINFKFPKTCIRIVDENPQTIFTQLYNDQRMMLDYRKEDKQLLMTDQTKPQEDSRFEWYAEESGLQRRHKDDKLQTELSPSNLEKCCENLFLKARLASEETGLNLLYLAIGFLEWTNSSNETNVSPLILFPTYLSKGDFEGKSQTFRYGVEYRGDDIEPNVSLQSKLMEEFHIQIPDFDEDSNPEAYTKAVEELVKDHPGWRVRREMCLGFFSFAKIVMYKEMDDDVWDGKLSTHPLIEKILGGKTNSDDATDGGSVELSTIYNIDTDSGATQLPVVLDADSSQHSAIVDVISKKKDLVVHGPPGTGKSQTIANIIAAGLAMGRKILFVAEKRAALDVVQRRLKAINLGSFVLELHSQKSSKGDFIEDLKSRMDGKYSPVTDKQFKENYKSTKDEMLSYSTLLQTQIGPGNEPIFKLLRGATVETSLLEKISERIDPATLPILDRDARKRIGKNAASMRKCRNSINNSGYHAWRAFDFSRLNHAETDRFLDELTKLKASILSLSVALDPFSPNLNKDRIALKDVGSVHRLFEWLSTSSIPDAEVNSWEAVFSHNFEPVFEQLSQLIEKYNFGRKQSAELDESEQTLDLNKLKSVLSLCKQLSPAELRIEQLSDIQKMRKSIADSIEALSWWDTEKIAISHPIESSNDLFQCIRHWEMIQDSPVYLKDAIANGWLKSGVLGEVQTVLAKGTELHQSKLNLSKVFDLTAVPDSSHLRAMLAVHYDSASKWYRFALPKFLKLKRECRLFLKDPAFWQDKTFYSKLKELATYKIEENEFDSIIEKKYVADIFAGVNTPWNRVSDAFVWLTEFKALNPQLFSGLSDFPRFEREAELYLPRLKPHIDIITKSVAYLRLNDHTSSPLQLLIKVLKQRIELIDSILRDAQDFSVPFLLSTDSLTRILEARIEQVESVQKIRNNPSFGLISGSLWNNENTDIRALQYLRQYAMGAMTVSPFAYPFLSWHSSNPSISSSVRNDFIAAYPNIMGEIDRWMGKVLSYGSFDSNVWTNHLETICTLVNGMEACISESASLKSYALFRNEYRMLCNHLPVESVKSISESELSEPESERLMHYLLSKAILLEHFKENLNAEAMINRESSRIIDSIGEFPAKDRQFINQSRVDVAFQISNHSNPPQGVNGKASEKTERYLISNECSKKRQHVALRTLLRRAGKALLEYKPCFMMSPLSVAHYLAPGVIEFDMVIMDEASQIRPEDALGAIARGKQVVIVGDSKQLPPTAFFSNMMQGMEEDSDNLDEVEEDKTLRGMESILDLSQTVFPHRYLRWHYRSQHENLIAFNNRHFYGDRLHLFPSPYTSNRDLGLQLVYVENGIFQDGENRMEGDQIVQILYDFVMSESIWTIGIATMNKKQQEYIERKIGTLTKTDSAFNKLYSKFEAGIEPIFVKNLENVQGDERDVIIVSTTYGLERDSLKAFQRFGPINNQGGARRLNVVFSRARRQMIVVTSLRSKDIAISASSPEGSRVFHDFLAYAEAGGKQPTIGETTGKEADSEFEVEVMDALTENGFYCVPQVGVSGFYIDIGVRAAPDSNAFLIGIECDGATYHSHPSIRDRDRIRQEILESKGWQIHRIWSTNWFKNRDVELKTVIARLNELKAIGA